jgi:hypothetical protein
MRLFVTALVVIGACLAPGQQAVAGSVGPNRELETVLQKLAGSTGDGRYRQIDVAIKTSRDLTSQLNGLAASGKLTRIVVLTSVAAAQASKPGPLSVPPVRVPAGALQFIAALLILLWPVTLPVWIVLSLGLTWGFTRFSGSHGRLAVSAGMTAAAVVIYFLLFLMLITNHIDMPVKAQTGMICWIAKVTPDNQGVRDIWDPDGGSAYVYADPDEDEQNDGQIETITL